MPNTQHDPKSEGAEKIRTCFSDLSDEIERAIAQERQQAVAEFAREVVKLSDRIELEGPDGGTKQWMAFKRFRNTVRDIAKERGIALDQPINSIFKE